MTPSPQQLKTAKFLIKSITLDTSMENRYYNQKELEILDSVRSILGYDVYKKLVIEIMTDEEVTRII